MIETTDWNAVKTPTMQAWEAKCLGGEDLREYLREARQERSLGRVAIAEELECLAIAQALKLPKHAARLRALPGEQRLARRTEVAELRRLAQERDCPEFKVCDSRIGQVFGELGIHIRRQYVAV